MSEVLQNKLLNYQAQPPENTWVKINNALNVEYSGAIGERLYNFQAAPNEKIWNKISLQLNSDAAGSTKSFPINQRRNNVLRYISAAAILVVIATGIYLFVNNSSDSDVANTNIEIRGNSSIDTNSSEVTPGENQNTTGSEGIIPADPKKNNSGVAKKNTSGNNRYMMLTTDHGNSVRVSKKLYAVFDCADNATALNNKRCKENIQILQRKMASALVTPTSDFTSVIDMIKTLEKEQ